MRSVATQQLDNRSVKRRVSRYLPLLVWMAFISFASTGEFSAVNTSRFIGPLLLWLFPDISAENLMLAHALIRKTAHFCEYFLLGLLAARAFVSSSRLTLRNYWFQCATMLVVAYALIDEYHQSFVPSRTASIFDSFIDIAGGVTGIVVYSIATKRRRAVARI
jgi:VanZ family protein